MDVARLWEVKGASVDVRCNLYLKKGYVCADG